MYSNYLSILETNKDDKFSQNYCLGSKSFLSNKNHITKSDKDVSSKQLSLSGQQSPSYLQAMKALQDRVKQLEQENKALDTKIINTSHNSQSQTTQNDSQSKKKKQHLERLLANIVKKDTIDEKDKLIQELRKQIEQSSSNYELTVESIQQESFQRMKQYDQRIQELLSDIENLVTQNQVQQEAIDGYKKRITELTTQIQKEKNQISSLQTQLDNFGNSTKILNRSIVHYKEEIDCQVQQHYKLQNYLDWYVNQYPADRFDECEQTIMQLNAMIVDLQGQLESERKIHQKQISELELSMEQLEYKSLSSKLQEAISLKFNQLQTKQQQNEKQKSQCSSQSLSQKQSKGQKSDRLKQLNNEILILEQKPQEDTQSIFSRQKTRQSDGHQVVSPQRNLQLLFDITTPEYENLTKQIISLEFQLKELDVQYDMILRQAQTETDIQVKQGLRQKLLQILTNIKELNIKVAQLVSQQEELRDIKA